jgi:excisionase family DNA binding protein
LHITESFVRRLVREQRIPYFKVGWLLRFDLGEINKWLDRTRVDPFTT